MVLKLIDICMNFITKNLTQVKYLDLCLTSIQKELIIQRLANHSLFNSLNIQFIIRSLFTSNIKMIKFYRCEQINESLLKLIARQQLITRFQLRLLTICRCDNVTGELLSLKK